jgi:L-fuconolactonase
MRDLSGCPNVSVKLGGLGMPLFGFGFDEQSPRPTSDDLVPVWRPMIETCIDLFGPSRCMFESNFPVDRVSVDYPVLWNTFKKIAHGYSTDERADLFGGTAIRNYGLSPDIIAPRMRGRSDTT